MNNLPQKELFETPTPDSSFPPVIIELRGRGPVPSFKNRKRVFSWIDKASRVSQWIRGQEWLLKKSIRLMSRPITEEDERLWMESAILNIESQLRSGLAITDVMILTAASPRSWIAARVPLDDSWTWCPEVSVRSELCAPGEEGATITIQRIR